MRERDNCYRYFTWYNDAAQHNDVIFCSRLKLMQYAIKVINFSAIFFPGFYEIKKKGRIRAPLS